MPTRAADGAPSPAEPVTKKPRHSLDKAVLVRVRARFTDDVVMKKGVRGARKPEDILLWKEEYKSFPEFWDWEALQSNVYNRLSTLRRKVPNSSTDGNGGSSSAGSSARPKVTAPRHQPVSSQPFMQAAKLPSSAPLSPRVPEPLVPIDGRSFPGIYSALTKTQIYTRKISAQ
jgi:hypothetical protein